MDDQQLLLCLKSRFSQQDTTNFNFLDLMHAEGSPFQALFYSRLFWPEFVDVDGMIVLKESVEDQEDRSRLRAAFESNGFDKRKTEEVFNLVEFSDIFGRRIGEVNDPESEHLMQCLAEMWATRLKVAYPNGDFIVKVLRPHETGGDIGIIFCHQ